MRKKRKPVNPRMGMYKGIIMATLGIMAGLLTAYLYKASL